MKRMVIAGAFCVLGVLSSHAPAQTEAPEAERIPLSARLEAGNELRYRSESIATMRVETPAGVAMENRNESIADLRFKVRTADEKGAEVDMTYDRLRVTINNEGRTMSFDSRDSREDDAGDILAGALRPFAEATITLVLDADGRIAEVRGLDGIAPEQGGKGAMITKESIISTVTPIFALRHHPPSAAVGEQWSTEVTDEQRGVTLRRVSKKKLERVSGGKATLSLIDETEAEPSETAAPMVIDAWRTTGEAVWDIAERRLLAIDAESEQTISGEQSGVPIRQSQIIESRLIRLPSE